MTETPNPGQPQSGSDGPASEQPDYPQPAYQQSPDNPYGQAQQPYPVYGSADPTPNDRTWAGASHWGTLVAAWLAMGFLAPLIIMLTIGNQSGYVRKHAVESLNFQISLLIYGAVGFLFVLFTFGLGALIVLVAVIAALVFIIVASVKAQNGEDYRYPLTLRLVS